MSLTTKQELTPLDISQNDENSVIMAAGQRAILRQILFNVIWEVQTITFFTY